MRAATALFAVLVVALSVTQCAGRPRDRQRSQMTTTTTTTTTTATTTADVDEYDSDQSDGAASEPSLSASEHSPDYEQEPAERDYGEPERVYGEPERAYGEPERTYGEPERAYGEPERAYGEPEQNYEVDEAVSVLSDGRVHGVQQQQQQASTVSSSSSTTATDAPRKSGYVVDGKHYRKYRVEEETPDGFIVGEYGVVSHHDGNTRGVRYTADSSINPRVIYEALAKFLALRRRR